MKNLIIIGVDLSKPNTDDRTCMSLVKLIDDRVFILDSYTVLCNSYPEKEIEIKNKVLQWECSIGENIEVLKENL